jgi:hypothetical protein
MNVSGMTIVLFGGSKVRKQEIIDLIHSIDTQIEVFGALSEEEGMLLLQSLPKIDIVLIGGRYTKEQRVRIIDYIQAYLPTTIITQPGFDYTYSNENIKQQIINNLK